MDLINLNELIDYIVIVSISKEKAAVTSFHQKPCSVYTYIFLSRIFVRRC